MVKIHTRRVAHVVTAAALLVAGSGAHADGLRFIGDLPDAPHVIIELTSAQQAELSRAASRRENRPEIALTREQRDELRKKTGKEVRWLFAVRKEALAGDCTCGSYNLGIVVASRLAVLLHDLGDHLGEHDLAAIERALVDRTLPRLTWATSPVASPDSWRPPEVPEPYRGLVARFPADGFATRLTLSAGWTAQALRLAGLPRARDYDRDIAAPLHALSAISAQPSSSMDVLWPESGARLEAEGRVYLVVPGIAEGELGPKARAWLVLEYAQGNLTAAVAVPESGPWLGATYDWEGVSKQ